MDNSITKFLEEGRRLQKLLDEATPEPWDTYDLDKQTSLVINLMKFSDYRMAKIVCGWEVICPVCGHVMRGKIWESIPKTCMAKSPKKCQTRIDDGGIKEILLSAQAT